MKSSGKPELFHQVAHSPSATVRRFVVDHSLQTRVRFRNIAYPEVETDLRSRGGRDVPALWDGERLFQGAEAVIARLQAMMDIGRSG